MAKRQKFHGKYVLLTSLDEKEELNIWKFYNVIRTVEETFYEKCIVMRSERESTLENQLDTDLLLYSTSHNDNHFLSPLSHSRRFLLDSQDLSESRLGVRSAYAFSKASRFAFESARA